MFNFFGRPRHIPVTPITTQRIRCNTPRTVPPSPGASPYSKFPPPPRKRYGAGLGPHRVDSRLLRRQKSLKPRRSLRAKAAHPRRTRSIPLTFEHLTNEVHKVAQSKSAAVNHDAEDEIFLQQLSRLNVSHAFRKELVAARDLVARSAEEAPALNKAREEKLAREREARERRLERQRMEATLEKQRLKMAHIEKRRREAIHRHAKNAHRIAKEHPRPDPPKAPQNPLFERVANRLAHYDNAWDALKNEHREHQGPIHFMQVPWPVLAPITHPDQITYPAVEEFLFHPLRTVKSPKDRLKAEMLRWHPDKFDARILGKVMVEQMDMVREAAGHVARILTQMMMKLEAE
jgi:hypothetical protein